MNFFLNIMIYHFHLEFTAAITASSSVSYKWAVYLTLFFIQSQKCSIGFKSGEYGGRKIKLQPASLSNFVLFRL
jgi:hypothetical protein